MSSSSNASRKETERTKLIQEKCQTLLTQMLRDEDNKYCVDCDAKGPRWASWNLGVFLCIRCAGIHRNLGVHISRVKSVNLDSWTPEQVISLQQMGNSRARAVYEAQLPDGFRRPQTDTALESFIRAKYEHKKYLAREWVPPSPPKVDWAKEIDEELERQKRKKKSTQVNNVLGLGALNAAEKKNATANANSISGKSAALPAPLPKPKSNNSGESSSPKTQRSLTSSTNEGNPTSNDLLGLSSPTKPAAAQVQQQSNTDLVNDNFSNFLSAAPVTQLAEATAKSSNNSLAQEEEDFFNQGTLVGAEKDKAGKLTKDSILALYAAAPTAVNPNAMFAAQPQPMFGMAPAYMGSTAGAMPHQTQQHQFMTPPNSTSMYNSPVMTAPTAFSAPSSAGLPVNNAFGTAQFSYAPPQQQSPLMGMAGGIMATAQQPAIGAVNLMHSNQSLLSGGIGMMAPAPMMSANVGSMMGGMGMPMAATMTPFQHTATPAASAGNTAGLNQQFGNLNIGNVWQ